MDSIEAIERLTAQDDYEGWMFFWVKWDDHDQSYVGYCSDGELCRDKNPTIFLLLYKEACDEWNEQQTSGPCK